VSGLHVVVHRDDGEEARCRHVLAMHELWRDLECLAVAGAAVWSTRMAMIPTQLVRQLLELIAALDRRPSRPERAAEVAIARDAAILKASALKRIGELTHETTSATGG
jgi:hypothetical protein